jgi:probable 2-oxoglutarate dehydrogenase E1 component DHKTD1
MASVAVKTEGFALHKTLVRSFVAARTKRLEDAKADPNAKVLDWATCEALAVGSLVSEGNFVRLCGQDAGRGTFSQRHMELTCFETGARDVPLQRVLGGKGKLEVVNSFLSELGVVAYEYGISIDSPKNLVIWEAQFGDFFNQAQVSIDTFVANSHEKWQRPTAM